MNLAFILALAALALVITIIRGAPAAFIAVYLPVMLLVSDLTPVQLEPLPDMSPLVGVMYGIAAGFFFTRSQAQLRFNMVDGLVVALSVTYIIGGVISEHLWTGVSRAGSEVLGRLGPYFLARMAFANPLLRAKALRVILACLALLVLFALIEVRLSPWFYKNMLLKLGLETPEIVRRTPGRFGFFRAAVSFAHPISFGNGMLLIMSLIGVLASTTPGVIRRNTFRMAMAGCVVCLVCCLSFSPWIGIGTAILTYLLISKVRWMQNHLTVLVLSVIALGVGAHFWLRTVDATRTADASTFDGSLKIRALIVQNAWDLASRAGPWGFGTRLPGSDLNLKSVDDAYLVFILLRGWTFLVLWLAIQVALAYAASKAMPQIGDPGQRFALNWGMAIIVGLMVAWLTVFADLAVTQLYLILLGFLVTLVSPRVQVAAAQSARLVSRNPRFAMASGR